MAKAKQPTVLYYFPKLTIKFKIVSTLLFIDYRNLMPNCPTDPSRKQLAATTRRSTELRKQTWRRRSEAYCMTPRR